MQQVSEELISKFRSPAFPGSYFLSFEGIEGAGKSSQIKTVTEYLEKKGYRVLILREPGGTPFGEKLRSAILNNTKDLHPISEAHLFASSRAQLLHEVILKELAVPSTVIICDRYIDSSLAYQGFAGGLGSKTILEIHQHFPLNLVPHRTFYIRIGVETSNKRQKIRNAPKDYFEAKGDEFYKKLIEAYDEIADHFPGRILVVDGEGNQEEIYKDIQKHLDELLAE